MKISLKNNFFILCCFIGFMISCGDKLALQQKEYTDFLNSEKSELTNTKIINKIRFKCKLQTPELITLNHEGKTYTSIQEFNSDLKKYDGQLNFILVIEDDEKSQFIVKKAVFDAELYSSLLSYANTEMQKDFELKLEDGATIPCSLIHMEPANSVQPVIRISVAFNNITSAASGCTLTFNDNLFKTGFLKFNYGKEIFEKLPKLKI